MKQAVFEYIEVFYLCPVGITGSAYIQLMDIYLPLTANRSNMLLNLLSGKALTHQSGQDQLSGQSK